MALHDQRPDLAPTKEPTALDVAWAAGIYEGEGTIHERRYASAEIFVTQKDPELLYRLRDMFGGNVRFAATVTVPLENQCYRWAVCGDRCRLFVLQIYSYLTTRRKSQIDVTKTLEFLGGIQPGSISLEVAKVMLERFHESKLSGDPRNVARRARLKQEPWYIKRRQESKRVEVAPERLM